MDIVHIHLVLLKQMTKHILSVLLKHNLKIMIVLSIIINMQIILEMQILKLQEEQRLFCKLDIHVKVKMFAYSKENMEERLLPLLLI